MIVEEYTPDLENNKSWWVSSIKESYYMQDLYENRVLTVKEADKQRLTHVVGSMVLQLQTSQLEEENG